MKNVRIKELILVVRAELKEKQEELNLLIPMLERACSTSPSSRRRFSNDESPESTENSSSRENVSLSDVETLKSAILELEGAIKSFYESVVDTFEKPLAASLQAKFRTVVEEQCDSADYIDLNGKRVTGEPFGRVLFVSKAVAIGWLPCTPARRMRTR